MQSLRAYFSNPEAMKRLLGIHAVVFFILCAAFYVYYFTALNGYIDRDGHTLGRDFTFFWRAIRLLQAGDISGIYSADIAAANRSGLVGVPVECTWLFYYPPYYLFLLWPFTVFASYGAAYVAWVVANAGAFAFAMFWRSQLSTRWCAIALSAPMVLFNLYIGQNILIFTALIVGGFRLLAIAPVWAGVAFGLASMKPQMAALIPFALLALGHYRAFAFAALTFCMLAAASGLLFGPAPWQGFFTNLASLSHDLPDMMTSVYAGLKVVGVPAGLALNAQTALSLLVLVALCVGLYRMRARHWTDWLRLVALGTFLATPYGFTYNFCFLSAAWVLWLYHQGEKPLAPLNTGLWLALWYVPLYHVPLYEHRLPVLALLVLLAFTAEWRRTSIRQEA